MKILVINPNSDEETNQRLREKAEKLAGGAYSVDVACVKTAPKLMATYEDIANDIPEMRRMVAEGGQYDAFVIACHSDPNLDLIREITPKPVFGIAEASMKMATMYGNSFAVISPSVKSISKKIAIARKYNCEPYFKTTRVCASNEDEDLYRAAKSAVDEDHVDCIVLGCANYANADRYIEKKLGVPVFEGLACALILASGFVMYRKYLEA